jgi:hypothetical protein
VSALASRRALAFLRFLCLRWLLALRAEEPCPAGWPGRGGWRWRAWLWERESQERHRYRVQIKTHNPTRQLHQLRPPQMLQSVSLPTETYHQLPALGGAVTSAPPASSQGASSACRSRPAAPGRCCMRDRGCVGAGRAGLLET